MVSAPFFKSNRKCNIIVLCFNVANRGQSDWNELLREFEVLQYVNSTGHENILKLIGACTQTGVRIECRTYYYFILLYLTRVKHIEQYG